MFELTDKAINAEELKQRLADPRAGGCVVFEGWVRRENDGREVLGLEYEAYGELASAEGCKIVEESVGKFGLLAAKCVHRTGKLEIGDMAVWVGVSAGHRGEAFAACRWIIDEIKSRVPIWKKERYLEGKAGWVNAPRADPGALDRA